MFTVSVSCLLLSVHHHVSARVSTLTAKSQLSESNFHGKCPVARRETPGAMADMQQESGGVSGAALA